MIDPIEVLLWVPVLLINGRLSIWLHQRNQRRQDVRFLKELHVKYPDLPVQYFYSIEAKSQEALQELRRQVQEHVRQQLHDPPQREDIPTPPPPPPKPDPLT